MVGDWVAWRQAKRAKKLAEKSAKRAAVLTSLAPDALQEWDKAHSDYVGTRIAEEKTRRLEARTRLAEAPPLLVDMAYDHLMTDAELTSLRKQLVMCYGYSMRASAPYRLDVASISDELLENLGRQTGFAEWKASFQTRSLEKLIAEGRYARDKLVYLTSDSDCTIEHLDPTDVYIIGGLVDRNRCKNASLGRAEALGLRTARLNLNAYVTLTAASVITVNQVFDLMLKLRAGLPLSEAAAQCIPQRKVAEHTPRLRKREPTQKAKTDEVHTEAETHDDIVEIPSFMQDSASDSAVA